MTTLALTPGRPPRLLLALLALALFVPLGVTVVGNPAHATKHASDHTLINRCLDDNGPHMVLQSRSPKRTNQYWRVCQLDDGRWGVQLLERVARGWRERTAFVPKSGTWHDVWEYVSARAVKVWPGG